LDAAKALETIERHYYEPLPPAARERIAARVRAEFRKYVDEPNP